MVKYFKEEKLCSSDGQTKFLNKLHFTFPQTNRQRSLVCRLSHSFLLYHMKLTSAVPLPNRGHCSISDPP